MSEVEDWIKTLGGEGRDAHMDAQAVRNALVAEDAAQKTAVPPEDDLAFVALMSRLEREGLLDSGRPAKSPSWWWSLSAAAVLVLAVAVGVVVDSQFSPVLEPHLSANYEDAPRFRGSVPVQAMTGRDSRWMLHVIDQLRTRNWPYELSSPVQAHWRLQFYVPTEVPPEGREWLKAEGIEPAVNGWVILQIEDRRG